MIRKFNESVSSGLDPKNIFCVYDLGFESSGGPKIIEVFLSKSDSDMKASELNKKFSDRISRDHKCYFSYSLEKGIEELRSYWSDYYFEEDESF